MTIRLLSCSCLSDNALKILQGSKVDMSMLANQYPLLRRTGRFAIRLKAITVSVKTAVDNSNEPITSVGQCAPKYNRETAVNRMSKILR